MATIADLNAAVLALQAQVTAGRTVEQSAETLLANLDKLYQDAVAGAPDLSSAIAAVQVVGEQVAAQSAALAAAVTANTPAAAPAPAAPAGA